MIDPHALLSAYASGIFPMAEDAADRDVFWVEPRRRAILPLDGLRLSASLRKVIRQERFEVTLNTAFAAVIDGCAASAPDRETTWINGAIRQACLALHGMGRAHSIECWRDGRLAGGLYGVALGRAFFGESMFSRARDASKVALAWLVARMRAGGFTLLDCQFMTDHLRTLGAIEISARDYSARLSSSLSGVNLGMICGADGSLTALDDWAGRDEAAAPERAAPSVARTVSGPVSGQIIVQLLTQTS